MICHFKFMPKNTVKPLLKRVKIWKKHCPQCGEMLGGNGSGFLPYYCKCGEWRAVMGKDFQFDGKYEILKK